MAFIIDIVAMAIAAAAFLILAVLLVAFMFLWKQNRRLIDLIAANGFRRLEHAGTDIPLNAVGNQTSSTPATTNSQHASQMGIGSVREQQLDTSGGQVLGKYKNGSSELLIPDNTQKTHANKTVKKQPSNITQQSPGSPPKGPAPPVPAAFPSGQPKTSRQNPEAHLSNMSLETTSSSILNQDAGARDRGVSIPQNPQISTYPRPLNGQNRNISGWESRNPQGPSMPAQSFHGAYQYRRASTGLSILERDPTLPNRNIPNRSSWAAYSSHPLQSGAGTPTSPVRNPKFLPYGIRQQRGEAMTAPDRYLSPEQRQTPRPGTNPKPSRDSMTEAYHKTSGPVRSSSPQTPTGSNAETPLKRVRFETPDNTQKENKAPAAAHTNVPRSQGHKRQRSVRGPSSPNPTAGGLPPTPEELEDTKHLSQSRIPRRALTDGSTPHAPQTRGPATEYRGGAV